jgi:folate-binding Fe-S cluster repair protein YgfZ
MHYRGHPNRTLYRLAMEGPSPGPGTGIFQGEKKVGHLTSIAPLPVKGETLALGYLSRSADTQGVLRAGEAELRILA